ncbi:MAG: EamA family transporter [Candidatus Delongbacteria bacterium]|nr:EamA family transporter [Candidatus Delongbacteria bacterium]
MTKNWLLPTLIATLCWGLWGFFGKFAAREVNENSLVLLGIIGALVVYPIYIALYHGNFMFSWREPHYYLALLAGVAGGLGTLFFFMALARGEASRVVVISALYPVVTVLLSLLLLGELVTLKKIAGVLLALGGIVLLAG